MTKGKPVQSDPLQFMRIIIGKFDQNLLELQEEFQRPDNYQKHIFLATSCSVGNDHLPVNWHTPQGYSSWCHLMRLIIRNMNIYGLGVGFRNGF